ncbi:MAG: hypothetical protein RL557_697 [archaeon]|jgi:hypothetical protein
MPTETITPYKVEGYGTTIKDALSNLSRNEEGLRKKLSDAHVSTDAPHRTVYVAKFFEKQGLETQVVCPEFTIRVESADDIQKEAEKRANGGSLQSYDSSITIQRYFDLDDKQLAAARGGNSGSARPPTAGYDDVKKDGLSDLIQTLG